MTPPCAHASGCNDAESTINCWGILDDMVEASLCSICWKLLDKMYTATCGHSYCMKSAEVLLSGDAHNRLKPAGYGTCPVCKEGIASPTKISAGAKKPALKHSVMIRHNFEHLRTWANWRKGQDDLARAAGGSIGHTRCNWRLNGWEIDVDDVPAENVDDDVGYDEEDDSDDATQAFSEESFEERRRQMQQRSPSPPFANPPPSLARLDALITVRAPVAVYPDVASRPNRLRLRSAVGLQAQSVARRRGVGRTGRLSRGRNAHFVDGNGLRIDEP